MLGEIASSGIRGGRITDLPQVEAKGDVPLQPYQSLGQQGLILVLAQLEQRPVSYTHLTLPTNA